MQLVDNKFYVYALVCPINKVPFYVGKGCGARAFAHLNGKDKNNNKKLQYIQNLRNLGFEPEVHFAFTNLSENEAYNYETNFIKFMANHFLYFTNKVGVAKNAYCNSNIKYRNLSLDKKKKSSRIYYPLNKTIKKKISASLHGRKLSDTHRKAISDYLTGRGLYISKEDLIELRKTLTIQQIAEKFNVSIQPIKRLIRTHKLFKNKSNFCIMDETLTSVKCEN